MQRKNSDFQTLQSDWRETAHIEILHPSVLTAGCMLRKGLCSIHYESFPEGCCLFKREISGNLSKREISGNLSKREYILLWNINKSNERQEKRIDVPDKK